MPVVRWSPIVPLSRREQFLIGRMTRTGKLFAFLRKNRHELFDDAFQSELEAMYRDSGGGKQPVSPALLAMVVLPQAYTGASDAQAVELSIVDARWQMVLGVIGEDEPPFSQGALPAFRQRLIAHDMDRRLLERTIELAKRTAGFDWKKLPKELRLAVDSRPLEGAGRVEDTFNLLAHAVRNVLRCVARLVDCTPANRPEAEVIPELQADIGCYPERTTIGQLSIDRGYIKSSLASEVFARGGEVLCKPWVSRNGTRFRKSDFVINMRSWTITCPAGQREDGAQASPAQRIASKTSTTPSTTSSSPQGSCPLRKTREDDRPLRSERA